MNTAEVWDTVGAFAHTAKLGPSHMPCLMSSV